MAQEEITVQTADEVSGVDYMRKTYTDDEIQSKVQKVKEMKNEESANSGNNENRSFRKRK